MKPRFFRLWHNPAVSLVVITLAIYSITAGVSLVRQSLAPHFVFLADAFLHSQLELASIPDPPYDLTFFNEHWYVSFPPLPALLLMPIVAIRGLSTSDIAFSVIAGGLCVGAMALALARLNRAIGGFHADGSITWLALLLGFGTPLWYCAALGSVWFTAHVIAAGCLCLYVREVLGDNRPFLAGVWLGLGFLARAPVLLAFPLSLAVRRDRNRSLRDTARFALSLAMGVAPMVLAQAAYNYGRFGSLLEFGYRWMNSPDTLLQRQATWGQFNARFLPENLYTLL
ncbi:MAG: hypothetical protein GX620_15985, partial [Chloroflexi bacterium]|nr:hypothetical protein [Chloroflexota bacterium]